ncbi:MAG TPA: SGNH/GDSL hydrolase family protein [Candidatus Dormibacteraeota bacterium]|nr:SGNH/GDSL hydrolase family protein [Candidatus Dormibacteraeota bacterium]
MRRRALSLLLLLCGFSAQALLTNNLVADWRADLGITAPTGRVSQWTDQHQLLNNDGLGSHQLTQTNGSRQPYTVQDPAGGPAVMFPWGSPTPPQTYLNLPTTLGGFDTANTTVYVVGSGPAAQENETLLWFGGTASGWLSFHQITTNPISMLVGTQNSGIYPPLNRAVLVGSSDTNVTTLRWNSVLRTNPPQTRVTSSSGGMLASFNSSEFYSGVIHRILIYKTAHTPAQMDAQVSELAATYRIFTNYTKQVVCRGASTVAGQGSTLLQGFVPQLCQRYPEIIWRAQSDINGGQNGQIGTNGFAGSMYAFDPGYIDTLYDAALDQNWLFVIAGINDILSSGLNGTATYGRLTNYVAARHAARPWKIVVSTVQSDAPAPATNADYNAQIRLKPGGWDRIIDPGAGSPIETRLSNFADTRYFNTDGIHLTNLGYSVLADHLAQIINVPRRTTGSFGP